MAKTKCVRSSDLYWLEIRKPGVKTWKKSVVGSGKSKMKRLAKFYREEFDLQARVVKSRGKKICVFPK